jgi:predicted naringenin-chalcone synthase
LLLLLLLLLMQTAAAFENYCRSAGVIALDLARELLELYPNSNVLVVSHENISNAFYTGKDPSMLLINVLFRANGAAIIMTNKPKYAGVFVCQGLWRSLVSGVG